MAGHIEFAEIQESVVDEEAGPVSTEGEGGDLVMRFMPDGSVDFGHLTDIGSAKYAANTDADVILKKVGDDDTLGFIDIRPTGRVTFKVFDTDQGSDR